MGIVDEVVKDNNIEDLSKNNYFFDITNMKKNKNDKFVIDFKYYINSVRIMCKNFIKNKLKKTLTQILFVSFDKIPTDYIISLQKQYPNKQVSVIQILKFKPDFTDNELILNFSFFIQNISYEAYIFKLPPNENNITMYGIFSDFFSQAKLPIDLYKMEYLAAYAKCVRQFAQKSNFDIIHSENIPLFLGEEFNKKKKLKSKILQEFHHAEMYKEEEPFWAFINIADKHALNKAFKDKYILNNLANLFNQKKIKNINNCLDYFFTNYETFRAEVPLDKNIAQNEIIKNLNKRILKLFPKSKNKTSKNFNVQNYSLEFADTVVLNSKNHTNIRNKNLKYIQLGGKNLKKQIINTPFNSDNFRNFRALNKLYLQKELSRYRIQSKSTNCELFLTDTTDICGYLIQNSAAVLMLACFDKNSDIDDYKSIIVPVLKAFELNKNIQFILNIPLGSKKTYVKSLIEFFESQNILAGKWIFIDGEINLPQFTAAADIILLPNKDSVNREELLYTALNYACIPVAFGYGGSNALVTNIFDDMNNGVGFKLSSNSDCSYSDSEELLIKVLNFHSQNKLAWNSIMKNAMNYDSSWNFERIDQFNSVYENLI